MPAACLALGLAAATLAAGAPAELLLIPDSDADRVMAFSPVDGTLIDANFITDPGSDNGIDIFDRPLNAIDSGRGTILVSDQFSDLVAEFAYDGSYQGIFSNSGVVDGDVMQNLRGIDMLAGDLLVCNAGGTNALLESQNNIKRFDSAGALRPDFAFNRYGGIRGPFDVLVLPDEVLVADDRSNALVRYTPAGKFNERLVENLQFPQQISLTPQDTLLVAVFSGGFIAEFQRDGTPVGQYDPGTLSLYRGVHQLDNGNLLVSTTTGVYEVTRTGLVVATEWTGGGARYIERVALPTGTTLRQLAARGAAKLANGLPRDGAPRPASLDDERGAPLRTHAPSTEAAR